MAKRDKSASFGAAECARRTGLTVRALRVYERHGLIKPPRSGKGWRLYGPNELARVNVIVTLKTFGLTLAQIRSVLTTTPPALARVLQLQFEALRARKAAAEKGLELVAAALARISSRQRLSIEELCNLVRSMEMSNHQATTRELINETIKPDEERAAMTWWAARPQEEAIAMREYGAAVRAIFQALHGLLQENADPAADEVQALIEQWKDMALRHRLRDTMLAMLNWNTDIAGKWLDVGERALSRTTSSAQSAAPGRDLWSFFREAVEASDWHQAVMQVVDDAITLVEKKAGPSSAPAKKLANRFKQICVDNALGDPTVYVKWSAAMQDRDRTGDPDARKQTAWIFLASAMDAAAPNPR